MSLDYTRTGFMRGNIFPCNNDHRFRVVRCSFQLCRDLRLAGYNSKCEPFVDQGSEGEGRVDACHTIQIDSLYSRAALRHRISSRSCTGTSAKLFSIMRADSG